jgi:hypothetical protein
MQENLNGESIHLAGRESLEAVARPLTFIDMD